MFSELTIIELQLCATVLMGYDYFVSNSIKERLDSRARQEASHIQSQSDKVIKEQIEVLRTRVRICVAIVLAIAVGVICIYLTEQFARDRRNMWVVFAFGIMSIVLISSAFKSALDRLVIEGLAPMILPLSARLITTYLLFASKGVIASFGMLILLFTFWLRYINATGG